MAYCTQSDIQARFDDDSWNELVNDTGSDPDTTIAARVTESIGISDDEIDSYIGNRYTVPFKVVPDQIKRISISIATYYLATRRWELMENDSDNFFTTDYKNKVKMLENIRDSKMNLAVPDPADNPGKAASAPTISSSSRIFTQDSLSDF